MKVAMTQSVAIGERLEDSESSLAYLVGHQRRPELQSQPISKRGDLVGTVHFVEACVYTTEYAGDRRHQPWLTLERGEQVRPMDTIEDQSRSSIDPDHPVHRGYRGASGVSRLEHNCLPVDVVVLGIQQSQTEHELVVE
jgi:hypothetical protein